MLYRSALLTTSDKLGMLNNHVPRTDHIPVDTRNFFCSLVYASSSARTSEAAPNRRNVHKSLSGLAKTNELRGAVVARFAPDSKRQSHNRGTATPHPSRYRSMGAALSGVGVLGVLSHAFPF
jgi:hypothetical protein